MRRYPQNKNLSLEILASSPIYRAPSNLAAMCVIAFLLLGEVMMINHIMIFHVCTHHET